MMLAAAPPLVMMPWIRQSGRTCCRSMLTALYMAITASRAFTPSHGSGGVRGLAAELESAARNPEEILVQDRAVEPVDHHRAVHVLEDPRLDELHLAAAPLLGGGADHLDAALGELRSHRGQRRARARARGGDHVVSARVPDARQRVVLTGIAMVGLPGLDGGGTRSPPAHGSLTL
jgi:hypothetical protein